MPLIPDFSCYHEPFLGGGAVFFELEPERSVIADVSSSLTGLYRLLAKRDAVLARRLHDLVDAWALAGKVGDAAKTPAVHSRSRWAESSRSSVEDNARQALSGHRATVAAIAAKLGGNPSSEVLESCMVATLSAKLWRIRNQVVNKGAVWSDADLADQAHTAVRAGLYTAIRDRMDTSDAIADAVRFFFLREFAYGGMFRVNSNGQFNIPYGGRSYDRKDFAAKVRRALSAEVAAVLGRALIVHGDWEGALNNHALSRRDFVFLDPPYDSEFSTYDGAAFTADDQRRLAAFVARTDAKVLAVMKRTPFIEQLYRDAAVGSRHPLAFGDYEKQYAYNVKGRNDRDVSHLVVMNYTAPGP